MSNFSFLTVIVLISLIAYSPKVIFAQVDSLGVAIPVLPTEEVVAGDILCSLEGGLSLCREEYAPSIYGVVVESPALALETSDLADAPLALQKGDALVRVTSVNGTISEGDLITSSKSPGVGQKATVNGFVLGIALEDYQVLDTETVGQILVSLNVHPTSSFVGSRSNLVASIRQTLSAPVVTPLDSLRYLLAFVIAIISFALGFIYFGRVVRTGVEAIGRNPLASRMIQATVLVNIVITIVIVIAGLAISLLILVI